MNVPRSRSSITPAEAQALDRVGMDPAALEQAVLDHLYYTCARDQESASTRDLYVAMAHAMRDRLLHRWLATRTTYIQRDAKRAYYLSAEFLLGRVMGQNLISLGLYDTAEKMLEHRGLSLERILDQERDPGLGNGGLGRLAACFLDSMASLSLPAIGYGIRYEYGIFEQKIVDGEQVERGDAWLRQGNPWEIPRYELTVTVQFGGRVESHQENGRQCYRWVDTEEVLGIPFDLPIAGYDNDTVNTLRLWSARATNEFNLQLFNAGDFRRAVADKATTEAISRVLYPADHSAEGKELRLRQQYFFCRCAIHDIVRRYLKLHEDFDVFSEKVAIQLNDTHPSIAIPELMRVLMDEHGMDWERAEKLTREVFGYTNHTLMPEALEKWPLSMFERLLPRHLQIIYEINARLMREVHIHAPGDDGLKSRTSIIEESPEKAVRMAHLAATCSHSINGVAALHSELVKSRLLPQFFELWPERFNNKTNGVTPRRWLMLANPQLSSLFDERVGKQWRGDLKELEVLSASAGHPNLHTQLKQIRAEHKQRLATFVREHAGVELDPGSIFITQIKRMHAYKRQLLNALHMIATYQHLKAEPGLDVHPRTFLVAGKAAPGYLVAKHHIKLINDIASIVNADPCVKDKMRVVFVPNYSVTVAEYMIPASDISLQISMAGTEASGTGNMKLGMNGALTVGTLDGANIEIREAVGEENFYLFGMDAETTHRRLSTGYQPMEEIEKSPTLKAALELLESGFFSPDEPHRFQSIVDQLRYHDEYMCCADFDAYVACLDGACADYRDEALWWSKVVHNVARLGRFSSDETIRRYASEIWGVEPVPVSLASRDQAAAES